MSIKKVQNPTQGLKTAKKLLYKHVDQKTALFLSGGVTPRSLYEELAREKKLRAGAVALVDERYGLPLHANSNEKMIKDTGLLSYLSSINIPFYEIFQQDRHSGNQAIRRSLTEHPESLITKTIAIGDSGQARMTQATKDYEKLIRNLFLNYPKRIVIMGIGEDGHTAGLPAGTLNFELRTKNYVTEIGDFPGEFKERITLTFNALSKMDLLIVLAFGEKKKHALELMFTQGSVEEIPARFFNLPDTSKKTIVITDQKV